MSMEKDHIFAIHILNFYNEHIKCEYLNSNTVCMLKQTVNLKFGDTPLILCHQICMNVTNSFC